MTRWAAVLTLVLPMGAVISASPCGQDTITVDGVPLELELNIMEVAAFSPEKEKRGTRNPGWISPQFKLGWSAGMTGYPRNANGQRLTAFLERSLRPEFVLSPSLEWHAERSFLRLECSFDLHRDLSYDARALDDSLYAIVADGSSGLEQWVRYTYDLGIELDTLEVPTSHYMQRSAMIAVSLGSNSLPERGIQRSSSIQWWAGFHLRLGWSGRKEMDVNRVPVELPSPAEVLGSDRNDWEPAALSGLGLQCGFSLPMRRQEWSWILNGSWTAGLASRWALTAGIQRRWGQ